MYIFFLLKAKLETYRDMEKTGKELSSDMKVAVSKYGEVAQTLDFAREFSKQILQIATQSEKDLKKKQKKVNNANTYCYYCIYLQYALFRFRI